MADVYRIQVLLNLGGNIAPELSRILKTIDQADRGSKNVGKGISGWASPIDRAAASMGKFAREVANARKGLGTVDREVAKMRQGLSGLKAPAAGLDKEMQKWATAIGRPLAEMRTMRKETQGVGSAARGVSRSIDSWAGRIGKAASAMQKMQKAAANVHLPNMPHGVGGGTVGGGGGRRRRGGGNTPSGHGRQHQGGHEGSAIAGGEAGHIFYEAGKYVLEKGAEASRESIRAKNAGLTPLENQRLTATANDLSRLYPSVSVQDAREQGRLLIPNVGDVDTALEMLPLYIRGQAALQTTVGPNEGKKQMAGLARALDIWGHSTNKADSYQIMDGFVKSLGVDAEAITSNDYVNAAQSMAAPGKSLSPAFKASVLPALVSQQGGARTGTDIASAYQNTVVGRGTDASILRQYDEGFRQDLKWHWNKSKTKRIIDHKGGLVDAQLYSANPLEWDKKHAIPQMVKKGILPEGYARGDYSQELSAKQKDESTQYLSALFSARRGANIHSILINDIKQIEDFFKRLAKARGLADVEKDARTDPFVSTHSVGVQAGNAASAWSLPAMGRLTEEANKAADALGSVTKWLSDNPNKADTSFSLATAATLGAGATGATGLVRLLAPLFASPAGIMIGTATFVITGTLLLPWDQIKKSIFGIEPGQGAGRDAHLDSMRRTAALRKQVGPHDFTFGLPNAPPVGGKVMPTLPTAPTPSLWERFGSYGRGGMKRAPAAPSMFDTVPSLPGGEAWKSSVEAGGTAGAPGGGGAAAAIKQAGDAIGQAGQTAAPSITKAGEAAASAVGGLTSTADGASKAGGALAGLVARISALGSISLPGAGSGPGGKGPAASPGAGAGGGAAPAGGGGAAPGKTSSLIYRGGAAPIQVATAVQLDGRTVGRSVTRHQVATLDTDSGTSRFIGLGGKTLPRSSMPVIG